MSKLTEGERLVALETKMDIVIEQQKATNEKLDAVLPTFITEERFTQEVSSLKRRSWTQNTLSAVLGVLLTLLITYVINDIFKG